MDMYMSETCPQDAYHLDMPTACPLVYEALPSSGPSGVRFGDAHGTWGTSSVLRHGRFLYDEGRVQQAQEMMRSQVLRDIAVSTISSTGSSGIATCDAWSRGRGGAGAAGGVSCE